MKHVTSTNNAHVYLGTYTTPDGLTLYGHHLFVPNGIRITTRHAPHQGPSAFAWVGVYSSARIATLEGKSL